MCKRKILLFILTVSLIFSSGCGIKNSDNVIGDLQEKMDGLKSYKAVGTMKIEAGDSPQEYSVEVWYKDPNYYRISLNNVISNVTQIVLRNDEGVFVLEPTLNKSYRFKSDWPESSGAIYLYQSLVDSIINDSEGKFVMEEDFYTFEVNANYQNKSLSEQKIWLDKELRPVKVTVFDSKQTTLVEMVYSQFEFDATFDEDAFNMDRNLTGWDLNSLPASAEILTEEGFGIYEPAYTPENVVKNDPKLIESKDGIEVVIKYTGEYNYNLIESRPEAIVTSAPEGSETSIVDLDYGLGVLTELTETSILNWTYDGIEFKLSGDLPTEEMIKVAQSVYMQSNK